MTSPSNHRNDRNPKSNDVTDASMAELLAALTNEPVWPDSFALPEVSVASSLEAVERFEPLERRNRVDRRLRHHPMPSL